MTGMIAKRKIDTIFKDDVSQTDSWSKNSDHTKSCNTSDLTEDEAKKSLDSNESSFQESIKKIMQQHYDSVPSLNKKEEQENKK
jgi:hypothetical protein